MEFGEKNRPEFEDMPDFDERPEREEFPDFDKNPDPGEASRPGKEGKKDDEKWEDRSFSNETPYMTRYPDEVKKDVEEERAFINRTLEDPNAVMIVAEVDGKIAGTCSVFGNRDRRKISHRCSMGIGLLEDYCEQGLGTAMLSILIELAKQMGYELMELIVVADNTRAQGLYRKCGFIEGGRYYHGMKFDDGSYHDEIMMYKEL